MLHIYDDKSETVHQDEADNNDRSRQGSPSAARLAPPLYLPKNRSTGNLALNLDTPEKARIRFSFDAGAGAAEYDASARSPIMTDHDHGLGLSGLRRIRQHAPPIRAPTLPSDPSSRTTSFSMSRSVSMTAMLQHSTTFPLSPSTASSPFTEDLSRFSSESLHSFSFAHQSEELLHSRQAVFNRSVDIMKDHFGHSVSANPALVSAQARVSGDVEALYALDLLARAHLVGDPSRPSDGHVLPSGALTGPPDVSGENTFDRAFIVRTASPEPIAPDDELLSMKIPKDRGSSASHALPTSPTVDASRPRLGAPAKVPGGSSDSSRTPTNESGTTQQTSPPLSRRPSLLLRRSLTDTAPVAVQQRLLDTLAKPFVAPSTTGAISPRSLSLSADTQSDATPTAPLSAPLAQQSFSPTIGGTGTPMHTHGTRWVPAAQAIFTTEAKPPWTILSANDLACLVFGVTKAEVRKMGILQVVQEERRTWLEKRLLYGDSDDVDADNGPETQIAQPVPETPAVVSNFLGARAGGITARLLSRPNSRSQTPQETVDGRRGSGSPRTSTPNSPRKILRRVSADARTPKPAGTGGHHSNKSRGVILCGDVVPIQKRNGMTGSASLWVKEKRAGLIWVLEEIHEDVAVVALDDDGYVTALSGQLGPIWGQEDMKPGMEIGKLIPRIPRQGIDPQSGPVDLVELTRRKYYTCRNCDRINIPATVEQLDGQPQLRISSFPHIAGIIVVSMQTLTVKSSNSVFCGALFGYEKPDGLSINQLIPDFDKILQILVEVDGVRFLDGIVVPEHSFRKASAFVALREGRPDVASAFLRPEGLPARHRDGSELKIDVQMRVVKSEKQLRIHEETVVETSEEAAGGGKDASASAAFTRHKSELVYALWVTYSRHLHATRNNLGVASPLLSGTATPLHQPSPGQTPARSPVEMSPQATGSVEAQRERKPSAAMALARRLGDVALDRTTKASGALRRMASSTPARAPASPRGHVRGAGSTSASASLSSSPPAAAEAGAAPLSATRNHQQAEDATPAKATVATPSLTVTKAAPEATSRATPATAKLQEAVVKGGAPGSTNTRGRSSTSSAAAAATATGPGTHKKTIDDFIVLEEMGQGAYGQVKLVQSKLTGEREVIKYVTKKRILVDTWTRDRRLGTVPLEIHVLDYLRRDGLRHENIVEMQDFFEDSVNYYIEMTPHGLPGMDLFDYIELRTTMEEAECRSIFVQVAHAIHHLHTKALVVHRDIKDENVILDGEGRIKLIDFGSAAYIKSGPFDVFVGTIDYAAPEVLAGRPYRGREQDVWALGILLYTIVYKENPFYSIDEIMDRDLRVPYTISDNSIDLIRHMLDRDVAQRYTIEQVLAHPWCQEE